MRAACVAVVVGAGLLEPLVRVLTEEVSPRHAGLVRGLAVGLLGSVAVLAWRACAKPDGGGAARHGSLALALISLELLLFAWVASYPLAGESSLVRAGLAGTVIVVAFLTVRACRRIGSPSAALVALSAAVLASPLATLGLERAGAPRAGEAPAGAPRTVVLLTVDTLRADRLGEGSSVPTPAIDALLAESFVFEEARSPSPWTKPSVASILTGVSPLVHGTTTRRRRLPAELETVAETLRGAGYRTVGLGLNVHLEPVFGFGQGFEEYRFPARDDWGRGVGARVLRGLFPERYPELFPSTRSITDLALERVRAHAGEPLFLWLHLLDPHWPYAPPAEFDAGTPSARIGARWGDHATVRSVQAGSLKLGEEERRRIRELYDAEVRYADACVGRLVALLKELDLYDDALIAFASDHGEEFWEHGRFEHGHSMYEEVLRVPLAFKLPSASGAPGGPAGPTGSSAATVSTESIVPTLLELCGLEYDPSRFTAPSLAPWWSDAPPTEEAHFGSATYYHGEMRAVVFDELKLVIDVETGRSELFDLGEDPEERRSIAAARPESVERGWELLEAEISATKDLRERLGIAADPDDVLLEGAELDRLREIGYGGQ